MAKQCWTKLVICNLSKDEMNQINKLRLKINEKFSFSEKYTQSKQLKTHTALPIVGLHAV